MLNLEQLEARELLAVNVLTQFALNGRQASGLTKGPDGNVWFTEDLSSKIGTIDSSGNIREFSSGLPDSFEFITLGPDGNLWFTVASAGEIGKMTPQGQFTIYATQGSSTEQIIAGPDRNMWFTIPDYKVLAKATPAGVISYYSLSESPLRLAAGPDGMIWFSADEFDSAGVLQSKIGKLNAADGSVAVYSLPNGPVPPGSFGLPSLTVGQDGNIYAADAYENKLFQITTAGIVSTIQLPDGSLPAQLVTGNDGAIWYTSEGTIFSGSDTDQLGRFDTTGTVSQYLHLGIALFQFALTFDSGGNLWVPGFPQGGSPVLAEVNTASLGNPTVTLANASVGTVVQGVLSNATPFTAPPVSVTVTWQGGQQTDAFLTPRAGGRYDLVIPRVFATTGTVPAQVSIIDSNGVRTVLNTTVSVAPSPLGDFLINLYHDLLGRSLDPAGSQGWLSALQHGWSRQQVAEGVQQSPEYRTHLIDQLYQQFLHRAADPAGLNGFSNFMAHGGTQVDVEVILLGSPEYRQGNGGSKAQLVDAFYRDVFKRAEDAGAAGWVNLLNGNDSAASVAQGILSSEEARALEVQSLYQLYLHRPADAAGLAAFLQFLDRGGTEEQVANAFVSSPEYFSRPLGT